MSLLSARMRDEEEAKAGIMHEFPFCVMKTFMDALNTSICHSAREENCCVSANFFISQLHTRCVRRLLECCCQDYNIHIRSPPLPWCSAPSLCTLDEITIRFYSIFTIQFVLTTAPCRRRRLTAATFSSGSFPTFFSLAVCVYNHL